MSYLNIFTLTAFDTIGFMILSRKFMGGFRVGISKVMMYGILYNIIISAGIYQRIKVNFLISTILLLFLFIIIYKKNIWQIISMQFMMMMLYATIQLATLFLIVNVLRENNGTFYIKLIAQMFDILVYMVCCKFIRLDALYNYIQSKDKVFNFIIALSCGLLFFMAFYANINVDTAREFILVLIIMVLCVITINAILSIYAIKNKEQAEKLKAYGDYLYVINEMISEIRSKQHEFDNHIQAISMLPIICEDYEKLSKRIGEYTNSIVVDKTMTTLLKLDKEIITALLYTKVKQAELENIKINLQIKTYSIQTNAKDYELVEVLGTLIDNAFEAESNEKVVYIKIYEEQDKVAFEIMNRHAYVETEALDRFFKKGFTTKNKSSGVRGFGLYNLNNIVHKNKGNVFICNQKVEMDNYISIKILI